jgi:hypothetical protein
MEKLPEIWRVCESICKFLTEQLKANSEKFGLYLGNTRLESGLEAGLIAETISK